MKELSKGTKKSEISEKILAAHSKIKWRKPSKFPGKLATLLISEFSDLPLIDKAYICELSCENDDDRFSPLVALECASQLSELQQEQLIAKVCEAIARCPTLEQPINVCLTTQVPEIKQAITSGMSRTFYLRK